MRTIHNIVFGDSRQMSIVEDSSVHLAITSPPYWQLKDYGTEDQIGFNDSYESYINNLNLVWKECYRVLEDGCRLCINIGDQFARSVYYGRYKVIPIRTEIIKFCETIGFDYMGAIIWQKRTTTNTTGGASHMGSYPYPRNGVLSIDYEFILLFKKLGKPVAPDREKKAHSAMTKEEWKEYFQGHWHFGGAKQDGHIAVFPNELPHRLIKMFSFVGDTILDPFLGSGTTSYAAKSLERNSTGFEINKEYEPIIKSKLKCAQPDLDGTEFEFTTTHSTLNFSEEIENLPYIFVDPHNFDKKVDVKKLQYGSKLDKNSAKREEFFRVKQVLNSTTLLLSNDLKVKLLGVRDNPITNGDAINFLQMKTTNQQVYLRFDSQKYDKSETLLAYVYLKNRTFLNAHLIKNGHATADSSIDYKNKKKFQKLEEEYVQSN